MIRSAKFSGFCSRGGGGGERRIEGKWLKRRLNAGRKWRSRHVDVGKRRRLERRQRTEQEVERRRPGPYARFSSRVDKGDRNRAPFWVKYIHRGRRGGEKTATFHPEVEDYRVKSVIENEFQPIRLEIRSKLRG